jgi:hypothetical protein
MDQTCKQIGLAARLALSLLLLATAVAAPVASARAEDSDVVVIDDITSWRHPVKQVFAKYAIKIDKVELFRHKTYPVFHVEFPFEPTEGFENARVLAKLEAELFVANGHNDYGIQDDSREVRIEITWNKKKRGLHENFISTGR